MKKFMLLLTIMFSLFCFSGCNSSALPKLDDYILLGLDISSNGQIMQTLDFSVNSQRISELGEEKDLENFKQTLIEGVEELRYEFLMNFTLLYLQNPVEEFKINRGLIISAVTYNERQDSVGFDMLFTSIQSWNYYHNSGQIEASDGAVLLSKNTQQGTFPFSAKQQVGEDESIYVGDRYVQIYLQAVKDLSFNAQIDNSYSPTLIYDYATFSKRIHSDSDLKLTDSLGRKHHIWMVNHNQLTAENTISMTTYQVNIGLWYILCVVITFIVGVVLYIFYERKKIAKVFKRKYKNH